ncbi:lipoprotein signal peptidase [Aliarcobacter thereius]|uniref:Lipoprotein signal peptidase n=2 Tax=Aliarcobacter thereius TaxID=544718 RepID=A0A1C0B9Q3_9BACT|nr:signal peptidase II [Aliarcobacter thereius]OCL88541.1 lipoprotein signal peptidase [Aliarcobacter thereius]OCL92032.1 lipoprotein signal peptidase [Aliarcobacter thereius]OCL94872.1 Lipoprotein signal peptidase [Aliarcobacter thereius LMG 24486]OCM00319.1 lipoprotein signal peptidase [Aliarcobacter thereius]QBF15254.1 prolipoprotein signal peptidase II [Aliarcobacter thereius LMG 24486]
MNRKLKLAMIIFIVIFIVDQIIKYGFANLGWDANGSVMSLKLAYNYGVAFSMFAFLDEYLKYIQLVLVIAGTVYLLLNRDIFYKYYFSIALLYAGGLSNILDRFTYGAVVDYFYWHYLFEFAIFNFADVMINLSVAIIIFIQIKDAKAEKKLKSQKDKA